MKKYIFEQNKLRFLVLAIFEIIKTIGTVGVAIVLSYQIDVTSEAISTGNVQQMIKYTVICVIYALLLGMIIFITEKMKAAYVKKVLINIRQDAFRGIISKNMADYHSRNSAEYITLLNQNIGTVEENYIKNILAIFESVTNIIVAVSVLMMINPIVAGVSIVAMAIPSLIPKLYGKKLGVHQSNIMMKASIYTAKLKDAFQGYEVLKTFGCETNAENIHMDNANELEESKKQMAGTMAQLYGVTNMASITVQFLIMLLSGLFAVKGVITIGNIIAVTQLTGQVIAPAFQLSTKISQIKATKPICAQIKELTSENVIKNEMCEMKKEINIENLAYSYDNTPVLREINCKFERGKKYAITGKSGSGKSTFLKLLAGYYSDFDGRILVDGEIKQCECALIHQNVFLFDDTIRNNITLYNEYSEEEILFAISAAGFKDVIDNLEKGLDTMVEENGARFSGGERQRIAIARAILHKKSLFLVDEATSSLDNETAMIVENSILSLENVTCITVTHRLEPKILEKYDRVLKMENGILEGVD